MKNLLNKIFKLEENKTTIQTEIIAGVTTFFAMCYIIIVNPNQMTGFNNLPEIWSACFVGGILAAVLATLLMAFVANKPFALAAGMGLNSFFFVSFILPYIINPLSGSPLEGYKAGLAIILFSGIIFLVLSLTGVRKYIAYHLPPALKVAIPAGIGLFIAFIGLQNSGFVVPNEYTGVAIADFTKGATVAVPAILALLGFIFILVFSNCKVKWLKNTAIISSILLCTGLYYICVLIFNLDVNITKTSIGDTFKNWVDVGLFGAIEGVKSVFEGVLGGVFSVIMLVITYSLVDMFDTLGTLYGASAEAGMLDENGDPIGIEQEMLCDSIGTVAGALTGTSTITTFVESSAGVAAGGRTGLSAFVTAILFLLCLFIAPLAQYVPSCATAPALIYVGLLMSKNICNIDFKDARSAATGFVTFLMMVVTYSISNGIMIGAITYVIITLITGKFTKKDIMVAVIALLGILRFAFIAM
ncbi:MAG: NCS2 family permease [Bacilli bacterium]|nr:NCS2 family permease [Bacilli bacterium]